jgi:hypothetical protein
MNRIKILKAVKGMDCKIQTSFIGRVYGISPEKGSVCNLNTDTKVFDLCFPVTKPGEYSERDDEGRPIHEQYYYRMKYPDEETLNLVLAMVKGDVKRGREKQPEFQGKKFARLINDEIVLLSWCFTYGWRNEKGAFPKDKIQYWIEPHSL